MRFDWIEDLSFNGIEFSSDENSWQLTFKSDGKKCWSVVEVVRVSCKGWCVDNCAPSRLDQLKRLLFLRRWFCDNCHLMVAGNSSIESNVGVDLLVKRRMECRLSKVNGANPWREKEFFPWSFQWEWDECSIEWKSGCSIRRRSPLLESSLLLSITKRTRTKAEANGNKSSTEVFTLTNLWQICSEQEKFVDSISDVERCICFCATKRDRRTPSTLIRHLNKASFISNRGVVASIGYFHQQIP